MKLFKRLIPTVLFAFLIMTGLGQEECKVLKKEIAMTYDGECKNGLAHGHGKAEGTDRYEGDFKKGLPQGEGKYTWENGDVYVGDWRKGLRNGEGMFIFKSGRNDSIVSGIWQNDEYKGPKVERPEVNQMVGIDKYNLSRRDDGNRLQIDIYMNGVPNIEIEGLSIISTSGTMFDQGRSKGIENIEFPVHVKIAYTTWNKLHTSQHFSTFEFELTQPGFWQLTLTN